MKLGELDIFLGENETHILELDELIPINDNLDVEFIEQATRYAFVAMLTARSEAQAYDAKSYLAEVYAQTDREVRSDLDGSGIKVTEPRVKSEVQLRCGYKEAREYELECREQYLVMKALTQALDMRGSMLISLGAHLRSEAQQTGMNIKVKSDRLVSQARRTLRKPRVDKSKKKKVDRILTNDNFDPDGMGF